MERLYEQVVKLNPIIVRYGIIVISIHLLKHGFNFHKGHTPGFEYIVDLFERMFAIARFIGQHIGQIRLTSLSHLGSSGIQIVLVNYPDCGVRVGFYLLVCMNFILTNYIELNVTF